MGDLDKSVNSSTKLTMDVI